MQLLWQRKMGWDDEIDSDIQKIWLRWEKELPDMQQLKLSRWNGFSTQANTVELHGFADASKMAYGACLYI